MPILVDPERNCIDAGANRGSYTYFLSRISRHVFAYEPNPAMREILQRRAQANVSVSPVALSDHGGQAEFRVPRTRRGYRNNAGGLRVEHSTPNQRRDEEVSPQDDCSGMVTFQVPTGRLDDEPIEDVGFIKIDVEGHEREVLEGSRELLLRDRPVLLIEIMDDLTGEPVGETIEYVQSLGYRAYVLLNRRLLDWELLDQQPDPGQGWDRRRPHHRSNNFIFLPTGEKRAA